MNQLIVIEPALALFDLSKIIRQDGTLAVNPEAIERRDSLLAEAKPVVMPETVADRDHAINVASRLGGEIADAEEDRVKTKDLFYKMCCAIDLTKKNHVKDLEAERTRINRLVGAFNEEQRQKAICEEQIRIREAKRIRDEQVAAEIEAERKAEALRKEQERLANAAMQAQQRAEAKGKGLTAKQKADALQAQLDAQERQEALEASEIQRQRDMEAQNRRLEQERLEAAERQRQEKAHGGAQRTGLTFTIPDIHKLYAAHRGCVRLEPDLIQLKYIVNNMPEMAEKLTELAGVTWVRTPVYSAKGR